MDELTIILRALNKASRPIGEVGDSLDSLDSKSSSLMDRGLSPLHSMLSVGLKAAAGVAVGAIGSLATAIGVGTSKAMSMEQQIADIASLIGVTTDEMAPLKDLIKDLGFDPKLKVDATEAADAIQMLARNGLSMQQILDGAARSTVLLSNATGSDFGTAADLATDTMSLFNIRAEEMDEAVNGISSVLTNSKFGIDDYRLALAQAGGMAKTINLPFKDFNTSIAATASFFASGSDAGTSFRNFLQRLQPTTEPATDAMRELGLLTERGTSAFFTATGQLKEMSEIVAMLNRATSGLSAEQRSQAFTTIFGADAMRTAAAMSEMTAESFLALQKSMGQTDAEEMAATRMDTVSGALEILKGIIDGLLTSLGDAFLPVFKKVIEAFATFLTEHADDIIEWANQFANWLKSIVEVWLPIALSGIERFFEAIDQIGAVISNLLFGDGSAFKSWVESLPDPWKQIGNAVIYTWDALKSFTSYMTDNVIAPIGSWISKFVELQDVLIGLGAVIAFAAGRSLVAALGAFLAAWWPVAAVLALAIGAVALIRNAWENDWWSIRERVRVILDYLNQRFGLLLTGIRMFGSKALEEIVAFVTGNETNFENLKMIWEIVKVTAHSLFNDLKKFVTDNLPVWRTKLAEWGQASWQWILNATGIALDKLKHLAGTLWSWVTDNIPTWRNKLGEWAKALWDWIVGTTPTVFKKLGEWLGAIGSWLIESIPKFGSMLNKFFIGAFNVLGNLIPAIVHKIGDTFESLMKWSSTNAVEGFKKGIANLAAGAEDSGDSAGAALIRAFGKILVAVIEVAIQIGTAFVFWLGQSILSWAGIDINLWKFYDHIKEITNNWRLGELAREMWEKFIAGLKIKWQETHAVWSGHWNRFTQTFLTGAANFMASAYNSAAGIVQNIANGLTSIALNDKMWEALRKAINAFNSWSSIFGEHVWNPAAALIRRIGNAFTSIALNDWMWEALNRAINAFNNWSGQFHAHVWGPAQNIVANIRNALSSIDLYGAVESTLGRARAAFDPWATSFRNSVWVPVQSIINSIGNAITSIDLGVKMKSVLDNVGTAFSNWVNGFRSGVWNPVVSIVQNIANAFGSIDLFSRTWEALNKIVDGFNGWISSIWDNIWRIMSDLSRHLISGFLSGLQNRWNEVTAWFNNLASWIPNWVRDALGIHSPSTVFAEIGKSIMEGLTVGVSDYAQLPEQAIRGAAQNMAGGAAQVASNTVNNTRSNTYNVTIPNTTGESDGLSAARRYTNTLTSIYA